MKLLHHMKRENSGLARSTLELVKYEEKMGHTVEVRQPGEDTPIYGRVDKPDIHLIHSQLSFKAYHDGIPKVMWMHGEPLSSVGNGISMNAIVDLAPLVDAFICMRKQEHLVWNSIKRTYLVPKGIDLEVFKPLPGPFEKLGGEPAILYCENWRKERNPLYICAAMQEVHKKYPNARLHLYNITDKKMYDTFKSLRENNKWLFIKTMNGPVDGGPAAMNELYNKADIVVSGLFPLYARSIECFGAGKPFIGPGYREHDDYPWKCDLQPESIAETIINCWENYDKLNYRKWAEDRHDAAECVRQSLDIYKRYI